MRVNVEGLLRKRRLEKLRKSERRTTLLKNRAFLLHEADKQILNRKTPPTSKELDEYDDLMRRATKVRLKLKRKRTHP